MLDTQYVQLSKTRMKKAKKDLLMATELMHSDGYDGANNRAYYSMFHAIRSILALDGVDFNEFGKDEQDYEIS